MRPIDRLRGLYVIVDAGVTADPVALGIAVLVGGGRVLQLRGKDRPRDEVRALAARLVSHCRREGALFLLNDDPALAAEVGADGVHLGQSDASTAEARAVMGPDAIVGRSTNRPGEVADAVEDADYVAVGPIFDTPRIGIPKPNVGLDGLSAAARIVGGRVPLVAIGGLRLEHVPALQAAGASAWAVISAISAAVNPDEETRRWVAAASL